MAEFFNYFCCSIIFNCCFINFYCCISVGKISCVAISRRLLQQIHGFNDQIVFSERRGSSGFIKVLLQHSFRFFRWKLCKNVFKDFIIFKLFERALFRWQQNVKENLLCYLYECQCFLTNSQKRLISLITTTLVTNSVCCAYYQMNDGIGEKANVDFRLFIGKKVKKLTISLEWKKGSCII